MADPLAVDPSKLVVGAPTFKEFTFRPGNSISDPMYLHKNRLIAVMQDEDSDWAPFVISVLGPDGAWYHGAYVDTSLVTQTGSVNALASPIPPADNLHLTSCIRLEFIGTSPAVPITPGDPEAQPPTEDVVNFRVYAMLEAVL